MSAELTVREADLGRLEKIGQGGTAVIFRAPDLRLPDVSVVVVKKYKASTLRHAGPGLLPGLLALVRFRERLADEARRVWDRRIVWPVRVVVDGDAAVGILMRLIPKNYFHSYIGHSGPKTMGIEVDALFGAPADTAKIGLPVVDTQTRLEVVLGIAKSYAMMHEADVVIGDISHRNVMFDPRRRPASVLVVDADSARVKGSRSAFSSQPHTPGWEPPEALRAQQALKRTARSPGASASELTRLRSEYAVQSQATDVYKFGLLVARILDPGRQRAVRRDARQAVRVLRAMVGRDAADLLTRSTGDAPKDRPTMTDWYSVLGGRGTTPAARPSAGPQARPPARPPAPGPAPSPAIPDGTRSRNWTYVDGVGWVRSGTSGGPSRSP